MKHMFYVVITKVIFHTKPREYILFEYILPEYLDVFSYAAHAYKLNKRLKNVRRRNNGELLN